MNDAACYPICASRMIFEQEPIGVSCTMSKDPKTGVDIRGASHMKYDDENEDLESPWSYWVDEYGEWFNPYKKNKNQLELFDD